MLALSARRCHARSRSLLSRPRAIGRLWWGSLLLVLGGCHADAAHVAEPTLTTPGAFIAAPLAAVSSSPGAAGGAGAPADSTDDSERYRLLRVLQVLHTVDDQAVYYFDYGVKDSLQEARDAAGARGSGAAPTNYLVASLRRLETLGAVVVGFRSLTHEEQDVLR